MLDSLGRHEVLHSGLVFLSYKKLLKCCAEVFKPLTRAIFHNY